MGLGVVRNNGGSSRSRKGQVCCATTKGIGEKSGFLLGRGVSSNQTPARNYVGRETRPQHGAPEGVVAWVRCPTPALRRLDALSEMNIRCVCALRLRACFMNGALLRPRHTNTPERNRTSRGPNKPRFGEAARYRPAALGAALGSLVTNAFHAGLPAPQRAAVARSPRFGPWLFQRARWSCACIAPRSSARMYRLLPCAMHRYCACDRQRATMHARWSQHLHALRS